MRCPGISEMREYFENMKELLVRTKIHERKNQETHGMLSNIKKYLNGDREYVTSQPAIGFDKIFRGYIVKDWHGDN